MTSATDHGAGPPSSRDELGLDDELVRREVKMRLFDRETPVQVGRYPIERRIGHGGMGAVYEAVDPELGRQVAIKIMLPGDSHADRTLAEARALAKLSHPNVVTIHEVGRHRDRVFLAMEYVHGQTLGSWLETPRSTDELSEVFRQAARGLHAAHRAGLVHRDFKPSNVLIGDDGRVLVIDFGLSTLAATDDIGLRATDSAYGSAGSTTLTQTGQLLGTPAYMAPEQFAGRPVDARTDIFAFAVALYEALSGERPFVGDTPHSLARELSEAGPPPSRIRGVSAPLWKIIRAALDRDPRRRPTSLESMIAALSPVLGSRHRWMFGAALVLAGTTAIGALVLAPGLEEHAVDDAAVKLDPEGAVLPASVAELADFEAMLDDAADEHRAQSAAAFLEAHPKPPRAHEIVARAWVGLDAWRRSCESPRHGLCARVTALPPSDRRCPTAALIRLAPIERDATLAAAASKNLLLVRRLAPRATRPSEPRQRNFYDEAMAQTAIAVADAEFELLLGTPPPEELFMEGPAAELSSSAFKTYFKLQSRATKDLVAQYSFAKGQPDSTLIAASRTALAMESTGWGLTEIRIPAEQAEHPRRLKMYCDMLQSRLAPTQKVATEAREYCQANAARYDVPPELATVCDPLSLASGE